MSATDENAWISEDKTGVTLSILAQPKASKSEIAEVMEGRVKIRLKAPPVEGEANKELIRFLAKALNVSKAKVVIKAGKASRRKRVRIEGISAKAALAILPA